jgi:hypothetical protein
VAFCEPQASVPIQTKPGTGSGLIHFKIRTQFCL